MHTFIIKKILFKRGKKAEIYSGQTTGADLAKINIWPMTFGPIFSSALLNRHFTEMLCKAILADVQNESVEIYWRKYSGYLKWALEQKCLNQHD